MLKCKIALPVLLILMFVGNNVYGGCDGVYFKRAKSRQLMTPIANATYIDIDGDGIKDLIGLTASGIAFYKGSINGFDTPAVASTLPATYYATVNDYSFADFNGDGKLDLAAIHAITPYAIWIFLNNGSGGFTQSTGGDVTGIPTANSELIVAVADTNSDGRPDLFTREGAAGGLYLRLQTAQGTFGPAALIAGGAKNIRVKDLNNDGKTDLLYTNDTNGNYFVRSSISQGNGTFVTADSKPIDSSMHFSEGFLFADFNNDGKMELASGIYQINQSDHFFFSVYEFNAAGAMTETVREVTSLLNLPPNVFFYMLPSAGDFDGDGKNDLLFLSTGRGTLLAKNNGGMNFSLQGLQGVGSETPVPLEFSGDGKTDFLSVNKWFGAGNYATTVSYLQNVCDRQGQTKMIDFDGDMVSDLVFWRPADGRWVFYDYDGTIESQSVTWGLGSLGDIPVPQDYDGDGKTDYAVYRNSTGYWYLYTSSNGEIAIINFGLPGDKPVPADFDGDGKADIAIFRPSDGDWYYLPSAAPGTYQAFHWGASGDTPLPMDYDGDNKADLAIYRASSHDWYILRSSDGGWTVRNFGFDGSRPMPADFDRDGLADLTIFYGPNSGTWYISTPQNLYGTQAGGGSDIPFISSYGLGSGPLTYRASSNRIYYSTTGFTQLSGASGSRLASWILPLE